MNPTPARRELNGVHQNTHALKKPSPTEAPAKARATGEAFGESRPAVGASSLWSGGTSATIIPPLRRGRRGAQRRKVEQPERFCSHSRNNGIPASIPRQQENRRDCPHSEPLRS